MAKKQKEESEEVGEEDEKGPYHLAQVATDTANVVVDSEGNQMTTEQAIVELLNKADKIEKSVAG